MLRIDKDGMMKEFINIFYKELEYALKNWKADVEKFSSGLIKELGVPKADFNKILYISNKMIVIYFKANSTLLADVYGTGSKMLDNINPKFNSYWMDRGPNQGQVNPSRTSKVIQGRPKGKYIDIFGREKTSTGTAEGEPIEKGFIEPIDPNQKLLDKYFGTALQIAEKFFKTTYLDNALKNAISSMNLSKYVIEVN